ncbi:MAG TPA: hypothetical protein VHT75_06385 [Acidimicrobiales bacterium]|jgi:hypothetical protein|nr:hypothetical protein [Acidimicrobiales bacterium]
MITVVEHPALLHFSYEDMLRYSGPGSPAGVAVACQAMARAFSLLDPREPLERRVIDIDTAFRGPGARDAFELVTRSLTDGRYVVTTELERPERGVTLAQFVFRFRYRGLAVTLLVRPGMISDEFIALARTDGRGEEEERRFTALKAAHAEALMAADPADIFDVEG